MNWLNQMGPYYFTGYENYSSSNLPWSRDYDAQKNFFLCPGGYVPVGQSSPNAGALGLAHIDGWRLFNYVISAQFGWGTYDNVETGGPQRQIFYGQHSKIPLVGEAKGNNRRWGREYIAAWWVGSNRAGYYPHLNDTANMLFLDGHAKNVGKSDEVVAKAQSREIDFRAKHN